MQTFFEGAKHPTMKYVKEPWACKPVRGHEWDAGLDLRAPKAFIVPAHGEAKVDFGLHFQIPEGYAGVLATKSGLNFNYQLDCPGGIIDCGFTGTVKCIINSRSNKDYTFEAGNKVVQMLIVPVLVPALLEVDHLEDTERGNSGFGSTGA